MTKNGSEMVELWTENVVVQGMVDDCTVYLDIGMLQRPTRLLGPATLLISSRFSALKAKRVR